MWFKKKKKSYWYLQPNTKFSLTLLKDNGMCPYRLHFGTLFRNLRPFFLSTGYWFLRHSTTCATVFPRLDLRFVQVAYAIKPWRRQILLTEIMIFHSPTYAGKLGRKVYHVSYSGWHGWLRFLVERTMRYLLELYCKRKSCVLNRNTLEHSLKK